MSKRFTAEQYRQLAAERGLEWLGTEVTNNRTPVAWRCPSGHIWMTTYGTIARGCGCPKCADAVNADRRRHKPDSYQRLAEQRGFQWIGHYPKNKHATTRWRCSANHEWNMAYGDIAQGHGCLYCAGLANKTEDDYHALATTRGIAWIGELPANVVTPTLWSCKKGHEWRIAYHDLGKCPRCAANAPKTSGDYAELARARSFFWLGDFPTNTSEPTTWQCLSGHTWTASYSSIKHGGTLCPKCTDIVNGQPVSQRQRNLHRMLGGQLNFPVNRYRIDIALEIEGVNIAVEYDSYYFHDTERDAKRDQVLLSLGWRILRIKSGHLLPKRKQLLAALDRVANGEPYFEIVLADWGSD